MKIQKTIFFLIAFVISLSQILLTSCRSDKVVSSSFIQKRKYTQGYHFDFDSKKNRKNSVETFTKNVKAEGIGTGILSQEIIADNNKADEQKNNGVDVQSFKIMSQHFLQLTKTKEINFGKPGVALSSMKSDKQHLFNGYPEETKKISKKGSDGEKVKINWFAIASLCFLISGFVLLLAGFFTIEIALAVLFLGIVFAIIARIETRNNPKTYKTETQKKEDNEEAKKKEIIKWWHLAGITLLAIVILCVLVAAAIIAMFAYIF